MVVHCLKATHPNTVYFEVHLVPQIVTPVRLLVLHVTYMMQHVSVSLIVQMQFIGMPVVVRAFTTGRQLNPSVLSSFSILGGNVRCVYRSLRKSFAVQFSRTKHMDLRTRHGKAFTVIMRQRRRAAVSPSTLHKNVTLATCPVQQNERPCARQCLTRVREKLGLSSPLARRADAESLLRRALPTCLVSKISTIVQGQETDAC